MVSVCGLRNIPPVLFRLARRPVPHPKAKDLTLRFPYYDLDTFVSLGDILDSKIFL